MKNLFLAVCGIFLTLFSYSVIVCGQAAVETVKFIDGSELKIPVNHFADEKLASEKITSFKILRKDSIFLYDAGNKAGFSILPGKITKSILAKHQALFKKIDAVKTSYTLEQNGNSFSIDAFDSVKVIQSADCDKCCVKASLVLLEIKLNNAVYYVPFLESLQIFKLEPTK